jgi:hypothetical protein
MRKLNWSIIKKVVQIYLHTKKGEEKNGGENGGKMGKLTWDARFSETFSSHLTCHPLTHLLQEVALAQRLMNVGHHEEKFSDECLLLTRQSSGSTYFASFSATRHVITKG